MLEKDGTEIDEDDVLTHLSNEEVVILLEKEEEWNVTSDHSISDSATKEISTEMVSLPLKAPAGIYEGSHVLINLLMTF